MEKEDKKLVLQWIMRYEPKGRNATNHINQEDSRLAYQTLDDMCRHNPSRAFPVIVEILRSTSNAIVLANLAAGPLETLLAKHADTVIIEVEAYSKNDVSFRSLLRGVWRNGIEELMWDRVQKAANGVS